MVDGGAVPRTFFGDKAAVEAAAAAAAEAAVEDRAGDTAEAAAVEGRAGDAVEERRTGDVAALPSTGSPP